MDNFPAFADYILVLLFGILLPFVSGIRSAAAFKEMTIAFDTATKRRFYLGNSFFLFIMALIIIIVWRLYQRPFTELGFISPIDAKRSTPWWMIFLFICLYAMDIIYSITDKTQLTKTKEQLEEQTPFMPTQLKDLPAYVIMCASAGVFEEIVFRGYLISFFKTIFAGIPAAAAWAVLTPALIFSIAHYYQGTRAVFKILVLSLLFGMIFWHSGSLWGVMVIHFFVDLIGGLLSVYLSTHKKKE